MDSVTYGAISPLLDELAEAYWQAILELPKIPPVVGDTIEERRAIFLATREERRAIIEEGNRLQAALVEERDNICAEFGTTYDAYTEEVFNRIHDWATSPKE